MSHVSVVKMSYVVVSSTPGCSVISIVERPRPVALERRASVRCAHLGEAGVCLYLGVMRQRRITAGTMLLHPRPSERE